jgi:hypothetical protein
MRPEESAAHQCVRAFAFGRQYFHVQHNHASLIRETESDGDYLSSGNWNLGAHAQAVRAEVDQRAADELVRLCSAPDFRCGA